MGSLNLNKQTVYDNNVFQVRPIACVNFTSILLKLLWEFWLNPVPKRPESGLRTNNQTFHLWCVIGSQPAADHWTDHLFFIVVVKAQKDSPLANVNWHKLSQDGSWELMPHADVVITAHQEWKEKQLISLNRILKHFSQSQGLCNRLWLDIKWIPGFLRPENRNKMHWKHADREEANQQKHLFQLISSCWAIKPWLGNGSRLLFICQCVSPLLWVSSV